MAETITKPPVCLTGEIHAPADIFAPGAGLRYLSIVESAMHLCISIADQHNATEPRIALGAAVAAGKLAQTAHKMVLDEERAEMAREDRDDKHLRLTGRTNSPHARMRQARADRRLMVREEQEADLNTNGGTDNGW